MLCVHGGEAGQQLWNRFHLRLKLERDKTKFGTGSHEAHICREKLCATSRENGQIWD